MSKKPKKHSKSRKSHKIPKNINNKAAKREKNAKAASAFKGEVLRVARTHGFIKSSEESAAGEYFVSGRDLLGAIPGDVVLFEPTAKQRDEKTLPEAKVVRILKMSSNLLTGTIIEEHGQLCLNPDSFGSRSPLEIDNLGGLSVKSGDKVSFTLKSRGKKHHEHIVDVTAIYGKSTYAHVCVAAYLEEKGIVTDFGEEALSEADSCGKTVEPDEIPNRLDLRGLPIFTIDGGDTKDIDDAISIEKNENGYRLAVHIADVSHYVTPHSALDEEAFGRGTSVYIADLVVPMLPKALSNGICSLNPNVDRLAFSCLMEVAKSGELKSFEFKKTIIRSRVQGIYSEINAILKGGKIGEKYSEVAQQIPLMQELATILKKNREGRFAPSLESSECKIICGENGEVTDIIRRAGGNDAVSEGIIEEFMLLANNAAARLAMENEIPFVYRIHEPPAAEKLTRLAETLNSLGIPVPELKPTAESLYKVLHAAKKTQPERYEVINMAVLRAMMKAKYSEEPLGHFGLVMKEYAHFTSPIRRYPDLTIHRILSAYLKSSDKSKLTKKYGKFAHESASKSTATELRAVNAERDCNKFYFAEYMSSRIGEVYDGVISSVTEVGVYVMLENTVEGRVFLGGEEYKLDGNVTLSNAITGVRYTLGDKVKIKCIGCNIPMGLVDFEFV
ncbi:MAG: ribonuclease R [Oscillospiraceae bacterium]|nr:ribonuclease R [Oscillospiraceae bacterium]